MNQYSSSNEEELAGESTVVPPVEQSPDVAPVTEETRNDNTESVNEDNSKWGSDAAHRGQDATDGTVDSEN